GRFGPYVQLGDPREGDEKPKMVSLLRGMTPETMTLQSALDLLSLPRTLGQDASGADVVAHYGRYGAYIKRGSDTRSLTAQDDVLTVGLERALELLAQEKKGRRTPVEPLRIFEKVEALGGSDVKLLPGRYGPYVTDGEVNASLPRDFEDPMALTEMQAVQLILDRRARGTKRKKKTRKKAAKKSSKKTTRKASKKVAKKTTRAAGKKKSSKKTTKTGGKKASKRKTSARKKTAGPSQRTVEA
ncbi:MAG: topoisomerase C-terminal repeat-containing protein, partial [Planctomycetota bacterium]